MPNFLSATEQQFIQDHLTDDVRALVLQTHPADMDVRKLAGQILARQKARDKLPTWYGNDTLVFPPALSVEQASSETTARYKASLVSGALLLDLTGGMGVDATAFARHVAKVIYVEQRPELAELAAHNLLQVGALNVSVRSGDGLAIVSELTEPADWLYVDPHRRDVQGGRVVRLDDCEPNVARPDVLARLLSRANRLLLKTSPLIDIDATIRQLRIELGAAGVVSAVESVYVVAVQGEVKEVLFVVSSHADFKVPVHINAVNLLAATHVSFSFTRADEQTVAVAMGDPQAYLYEPNAAVLKAGAFRSVAHRFGLTKLAPHSHLYTSHTPVVGFPGRVFSLQHVLKPDRKALQAVLPTLKANLTVRNFPQTVAELRKKLALRDGGDRYILATTLLNGDKRLLVAQKIEPGQGQQINLSSVIVT